MEAAVSQTEPMKLCTKRNHMAPLSAFSKCNATKDGRQAWCKECVSMNWAQYYSNKPFSPQSEQRA